MIEGAEGMTHVLPEATGDPPHLLEQPSIVARCGGMIEPTGAPSSPASLLTRELVAKQGRRMSCSPAYADPPGMKPG
jgi:hypothetical protein